MLSCDVGWIRESVLELAFWPSLPLSTSDHITMTPCGWDALLLRVLPACWDLPRPWSFNSVLEQLVPALRLELPACRGFSC